MVATCAVAMQKLGCRCAQRDIVSSKGLRNAWTKTPLAHRSGRRRNQPLRRQRRPRLHRSPCVANACSRTAMGVRTTPMAATLATASRKVWLDALKGTASRLVFLSASTKAPHVCLLATPPPNPLQDLVVPLRCPGSAAGNSSPDATDALRFRMVAIAARAMKMATRCARRWPAPKWVTPSATTRRPAAFPRVSLRMPVPLSLVLARGQSQWVWRPPLCCSRKPKLTTVSRNKCECECELVLH